MSTKNKTPVDAEALESLGNDSEAKHNKPPCKIHRILAAFERGESLNFIEAQQKYHDRSLHSTASEIQNDCQITVAREWETVPGYMGEPTRCRRYWLEPDMVEKARRVLA